MGKPTIPAFSMAEPSPSAHSPAPSEDIETAIAGVIPGLRDYVAGFLPGGNEPEELAQETAVFLWEHRADFQPGTNFRAWAMRVAWFKIMARRRDLARQGKVVFSEGLMEKLAARAEEIEPENGERIAGLRHCVSRLGPRERRLLEWKYVRGASLTELAALSGQSADALHKSISRLRLALRRCIEKFSATASP